MVDISLYPTRGTCQFPNIFEQLATGRVETVTVEADRSFLDFWEIGIHVEEIDGVMHLYPFISYEHRSYPEVRIGFYLKTYDSKYCVEKKVFLHSRWHAEGIRMKLTDLKPELLDDGALIIEYGIRVEAIQERENIWNFQIYTDLFDSKGKQVMSLIWENEDLRCHPQIKAIHYDNSFGSSHLYTGFIAYISLQIAHGVRYQNFINDIPWLTCDARVMEFRNVVQYCQWQLIQNPSFKTKFNKIFIALKYDMRIYLAHLIRGMNSKKKLMKILKDVDIDKMSGESMKTFMKFLIYG